MAQQCLLKERMDSERNVIFCKGVLEEQLSFFVIGVQIGGGGTGPSCVLCTHKPVVVGLISDPLEQKSRQPHCLLLLLTIQEARFEKRMKATNSADIVRQRDENCPWLRQRGIRRIKDEYSAML